VEKVGDLMRRMGFREEASDELKVAFIRSLARHAHDTETRKRFSQPKTPTEEQLSFDFQSTTEPTAKLGG
jgi:hypothetical protein